MEREIDLKAVSDGRLYGANDMVKADCGDCEGCSACCRGMGTSIILDPLDIFRMTGYLDCSFEQLLEERIELQVVDGMILPNLKMAGADEMCSFLNREGRCTIHPARPGICRIFPLGRLYENGELLTKKQSDYIADGLFEQYKKEYEILKLNTEPDRATAQYRAEERGELLTPRSPCWFKRLFGQRKNKAAELIEREEQKIAEEGFAARESVLDSQADKPSEEQAAEGAENLSESAEEQTERSGQTQEQAEAVEQGGGSDIALQEKSRAPRKPKADRETTAQRVKA